MTPQLYSRFGFFKSTLYFLSVNTTLPPHTHFEVFVHPFLSSFTIISGDTALVEPPPSLGLSGSLFYSMLTVANLRPQFPLYLCPHCLVTMPNVYCHYRLCHKDMYQWISIKTSSQKLFPSWHIYLYE